MSDSLRPHEPQHARPPCPSPTPGVHPNPCPLSRWCHPTISSSVIPFSSFPQSFPASGSFPMSQLFASGGQSIGISASTSFVILYYIFLFIFSLCYHIFSYLPTLYFSVHWVLICWLAIHFISIIISFFLFLKVSFSSCYSVIKSCLTLQPDGL